MPEGGYRRSEDGERYREEQATGESKASKEQRKPLDFEPSQAGDPPAYEPTQAQEEFAKAENEAESLTREVGRELFKGCVQGIGRWLIEHGLDAIS